MAAPSECLMSKAGIHPCCLAGAMRHDRPAEPHRCCLCFPVESENAGGITFDCSGGAITKCVQCGAWMSAKAGPCGIQGVEAVTSNQN